MKRPKTHQTTTKLDRFKILLGFTMVVIGMFILVFVGLIYNYSNLWVWIIGTPTVITGIILARHTSSIADLIDLLSFWS